jgi:hypothetical protein
MKLLIMQFSPISRHFISYSENGGGSFFRNLGTSGPNCKAIREQSV